MSPKARHRSSILAALCFVIGSLAWYWDEWVLVGTTFYLVGSCLFLLNAVLNAPEN